MKNKNIKKLNKFLIDHRAWKSFNNLLNKKNIKMYLKESSKKQVLTNKILFKDDKEYWQDLAKLWLKEININN